MDKPREDIECPPFHMQSEGGWGDDQKKITEQNAQLMREYSLRLQAKELEMRIAYEIAKAELQADEKAAKGFQIVAWPKKGGSPVVLKHIFKTRKAGEKEAKNANKNGYRNATVIPVDHA